MVMKKSYLTKEQLELLAKTIGECEKTTSGEIRVMVASRSSFTGHVFPLLAMIFGLVTVSVLWALHIQGPWWEFAAILLGVEAVAFFIAPWPFFQRRLTSPEDQFFQVWNRAEREFYAAKMHETRDRTGILIFLSMLERRAVVLADTGIAEKLPKETWQGVIDIALKGAGKDSWAEQGLAPAIKACGALLAKHFPPRSDDKNELSDLVVLLD
jgi:putative membrane protein